MQTNTHGTPISTHLLMFGDTYFMLQGHLFDRASRQYLKKMI